MNEDKSRVTASLRLAPTSALAKPEPEDDPMEDNKPDLPDPDIDLIGDNLDDSLELGASALNEVTSKIDEHNSTSVFDPQGDYSDLYVPLPEEQRSRKRDDRFTAQCELCDVLLSSLETLVSHVSGIKHMQEQIRHEERLANGRDEQRFFVRQIPNPVSARRKVPIRFQAKIKETVFPVIGLSMVDEFIPVYDDEMEPYYQCNVCEKTGEANMMVTHVTSTSHMQKAFEMKFPNDPAFLEISRHDLVKLCERFKENDKVNLVNTVESDLLFPWPDRKAPWSTAQGGDGTVPPFARENVANTQLRFVDHPVWRNLHEQREKGKKYFKGNVPNSKEIPEIKDLKQAAEFSAFLSTQLLPKLENFLDDLKPTSDQLADADLHSSFADALLSLHLLDALTLDDLDSDKDVNDLNEDPLEALRQSRRARKRL